MGNKKYGEEMSKVLHFSPKPKADTKDIYGKVYDKEEREAYISGDSETKDIFKKEKFYLRPSDDEYNEVIESSRTQNIRKKTKKIKAEGVSKKGLKIKKDKKASSSKVVERERKKAILSLMGPSKAHKRTVLVTIGLIFVSAMCISFFYVSSKVAIVQYENIELKKTYKSKIYEKKELEAKLESSNRSDIIEKVAQEQLGMNYPRPDQIVYIKSN
ncbi:MAG: hypothetical protein ACRDA4_02265 [Filifactoraceae bacterium]